MYMYMYICIYICIYISISISVSLSIYLYPYISTWTQVRPQRGRRQDVHHALHHDQRLRRRGPLPPLRRHRAPRLHAQGPPPTISSRHFGQRHLLPRHPQHRHGRPGSRAPVSEVAAAGDVYLYVYISINLYTTRGLKCGFASLGLGGFHPVPGTWIVREDLSLVQFELYRGGGEESP